MPPPYGRIHRVLSVTPTVSASAYADGDNIGGKLSFAGGARSDGLVAGAGVIKSIVITDLALQASAIGIEIAFFDADPSATTFTDNAALTVADADLVKIVGGAVVSTRQPFAANEFLYSGELYIPFDLGANTTLYAALIATGTTTPVSTGDITVRVGILQD